MKTAPLLLAASVLSAAMMFSAGVCAQSSQPITPPPPPGLDDPGVVAVAPASASTARSSKLAPLILPAMKSGDTRLGRPDASIPEVRVRKEGDNTVQEYSRNGRVYMIVVTPKHGLTQTYMVDASGRVFDEHGKKPVTPVMYKVMEWGKSKPATTEGDAASGESGH